MMQLSLQRVKNAVIKRRKHVSGGHHFDTMDIVVTDDRGAEFTIILFSNNGPLQFEGDKNDQAT